MKEKIKRIKGRERERKREKEREGERERERERYGDGQTIERREDQTDFVAL